MAVLRKINRRKTNCVTLDYARKLAARPRYWQPPKVSGYELDKAIERLLRENRTIQQEQHQATTRCGQRDSAPVAPLGELGLKLTPEYDPDTGKEIGFAVADVGKDLILARGRTPGAALRCFAKATREVIGTLGAR